MVAKTKKTTKTNKRNKKNYINKVFNSSLILFFLFFLVLIHFFKLWKNEDNESMLLFMVITVVIYTQCKNMILVLGIPLVVITLLTHMRKSFQTEGFTPLIPVCDTSYNMGDTSKCEKLLDMSGDLFNEYVDNYDLSGYDTSGQFFTLMTSAKDDISNLTKLSDYIVKQSQRKGQKQCSDANIFFRNYYTFLTHHSVGSFTEDTDEDTMDDT